MLQNAYNACRNPFERGRSLLETGKTLLIQRKVAGATLVAEPDTATKTLKQAAELFSSHQANYWLTATYLALAEAEPELSKYWQGKARLTALTDRAYTLLFDTNGNEVAGPDRQLIIRLHGKPGVVVGDFEVTFPTKHAELLVYALALAGRSGEDRTTLTERLWPGTDGKQGSQKLRTALWQAKTH